MKTFVCDVARADGTRLSLTRTTVSQEVLVRDLNAEGLLILRLEDAARSQSPVKRLKPASVLRFTEILATLTANGLTLKDALGLARPLGGRDLAPFLHELDSRVQKGTSLFEALRQGPRGFSALYLGLIRIGEQTGDLSAILPRLAAYLKSRQALRDKTISALVYPGFVLAVALLGIALLSIFVLPVLTGTIAGVNPEAARQYQANVAQFQTGAAAVFVVLGVGAAAVLTLGRWAATDPAWAVRLDDAVLRLPVVGKLVWQTTVLHLCFCLEILLSSGFSLEMALAESREVVANKALRARWERTRTRVVKGTSLSRALRSEEGFPEVFLGWVEVGEAAHDLRRSFEQLRAYYQNEVDLLTVRFAHLAEPTLIVVVGALVIGLVLTFVTPIFTMLGRLF